jgi:3-hexulose-6-phosphate synthase
VTQTAERSRSIPRLQVALDFETLDDALAMAAKVAPSVDILEAGTPLIKAEGIRAVAAVKKAYPDRLVCADLKTADAGFIEVQMAARAKADIVTVLADAYDETILGALQAAHQYHVEIMADLIMSRLPVSRLADIIGMKYRTTEIHYACVHSGLDRSARRTPLSELESVSRLRDHPRLCVAGGLRVPDVAKVLVYPVDIIIVGGGITQSKDPAKTAKEFHAAIQKAPDVPLIRDASCR